MGDIEINENNENEEKKDNVEPSVSLLYDGNNGLHDDLIELSAMRDDLNNLVSQEMQSLDDGHDGNESKIDDGQELKEEIKILKEKKEKLREENESLKAKIKRLK